MSGKEEKKKRQSLSKKEYSVLVSSVCFSTLVLAAIGIAAYKIVRVVLRMM